MKICLFGGTFDPPHIGHLLIAQTIFESEHFDKLFFIPALNPPHKDSDAITPIEHRVNMLELVIKDNPHFEISDLEVKRGGVSYTIDTIQSLKKENGFGSDDLYFLLGSDTLKSFHKWKEPESILDECQVIVAVRPGFRPSDIPAWILSQIRFANLPRIEISATTIRERWRTDKTIRYMVTQPVWEYINKKNLYL
ncbi:MAG: nicotinate (nicotinamide) nucleotide adenylyltransferase [Candidatus Marinimicrobia bacterium]|jgi:nicotinate-nucleotide adenylyltransferase|nr:nicotinate (nicotinamide) nucleotide adenylyltransferase [Candidatus Neomarinimicrobiota bacterium]MDP6789260.1 nicotinate (nicotinamide) nucleotide adenylyltransferase [Candidatus Neomarinimicrobiota bacterium]MDP7072558.1 nicotinate (nicotinamide) nucleotide adenylyltransferase [Candidatus Neomarinimicrobiota bacterium]